MKLADPLRRMSVSEPRNEEISIPSLVINTEDMKEAQAKHKFCIKIRSSLQGKNRKRYRVVDDILYKVHGNNTCLVVPKACVRLLLFNTHSVPISGHLGIKKCLEKLKNKYYWPGMGNSVIRFIQRCTPCQERKGPQKRVGLLQPIKAKYTWEMVSTDVIGPFPPSINNNRYIIVAICLFSKYAETEAVENQEASTVVSFLHEKVFCRHGAPKHLLSDNGTNYCSNLLKEYSARHKVKHLFTSPFHSECNGEAERFNRTIEDILSKYVSKLEHTEWDKHLTEATFSYNSSIHSATGVSPFECIFGRKPSFAYDFRIVRNIPTQNFETVRSKVQQNLKKYQEKYKKQADKTRKQGSFSVGDAVYLKEPRVPAGLARKLYRPYTLGRVIKKLSDLTYVVQDLRTETEHRVNIKRLKPAYSDSESSELSSTSDMDGSNEAQPLFSSSSENEQQAASTTRRKTKSTSQIPVYKTRG